MYNYTRDRGGANDVVKAIAHAHMRTFVARRVGEPPDPIANRGNATACCVLLCSILLLLLLFLSSLFRSNNIIIL